MKEQCAFGANANGNEFVWFCEVDAPTVTFGGSMKSLKADGKSRRDSSACAKHEQITIAWSGWMTGCRRCGEAESKWLTSVSDGHKSSGLMKAC